MSVYGVWGGGGCLCTCTGFSGSVYVIYIKRCVGGCLSVMYRHRCVCECV